MLSGRVPPAAASCLAARVPQSGVLELFAGTGSLSLECLSRGAARALCVESSARYAGYVKENVRSSGLDAERLQVRVQDAYVAIHQLAEAGLTFDLVFADPPYGEKNQGRRSTSHAQRLLDNLHLPSVLATGGYLILGHARRDTLTLPDERWHERKCLRHGDSVMRFLEKRNLKAT